MWGFGKGYADDDVRQAFKASLDAGITFYDTAELYGVGKSERLLGQFIRETNAQVIVATKFLPFPWRLTKGQLISALRGSLKRLGMTSVDLYQIHLTMPPRGRNVGKRPRRRARPGLDAGGRRLELQPDADDPAATQCCKRAAIRWRRIRSSTACSTARIERNGTLKSAQERGVNIIAYSPLGKGLLTGKYSLDNPPPGVRGMGARATLEKLPPLIDLMREIGAAHASHRATRQSAQVAINWTICKGTLPIPGAKNAQQAAQNAGALGWRLTGDEIAELDHLSAKL